jgi:RNA polymerase sigma-70 factor, ECF subfamily
MPSADGLQEIPEEGLEAADLYLACAVVRGEAAALAVFQRNFIEPSRSSIQRVHSAPDFVDDAIQELMFKMLVGGDARLARYSGSSPLEAWVRVTATRLAIDMVRSSRYRAHEAPAELVEEAAGHVGEPELDLLRHRLGPAFQQALRAAIDGLSARERLVLRMHLVQGLSIDQIAQPYQVHRATAARWLADIRRRILDDVHQRILAGELRLGHDDLDSVGRLVASKLHLSLARLDTRPH